ncbi:penicillin-binding protein 1C [Pseudooceanicola sp. C21-150M6]|uniref:penicillin-binding protein 1C n=1 Tax=Pseudooceanicola sp. C21-150M6 TaxID=3434355 RepID=UPI003D7FDB7D
MTRPAAALLALVLLLWSGAALRDLTDRWIDRTDLPPLALETSAEIRDRNGELLRVFTVADGRWRLAMTVEQADPGYLRMLTGYEDRRFYSHPGVDVLALARAAWQAVRTGGIVSGGSTLTMQVARLLEASGTGSWRGKLRQARLALALERQLTKSEILGLYLHLAPMGGNLEGLRAASLSYFGKEPHRLTTAESAMLVALPQSPETRRPDRHPETARAARDRVLNRLVAHGVLTTEAATVATSEPAPARRHGFPALAPHLTQHALLMAPDQTVQELTLDAPLQARLEALARRSLRDKPANLSIAILVADHYTGEILASVGSQGIGDAEGQGFVDMTRAVRSPGSTLKPLVYGLAFDAGLVHPETLIADRPMNFDGYAPQNFDGRFRGDVRIAEALRLSLNLPAVQLTAELGPHNLIAALRRAGAAPVVPGGRPGLAVSLGGLGMTLTDLTQLYAAFARGGDAIPLHMRHGAPPAPSHVITPVAAWQVGHILAGLLPQPGGSAAPIAYKTGTSYGYRDAWAVGYDGQHVIGVWIGRPDGTPVPGASGATFAAPVLFQAFDRLKPSLTPLPPPPPATLLVGAARLPEPLQRFRPRDGYRASGNSLQLTFPPDGASLFRDGPLPAKVREGTPPFAWLANGRPVMVGVRSREVLLSGLTQGFTDLTVIDASGQSARVSIELQ